MQEICVHSAVDNRYIVVVVVVVVVTVNAGDMCPFSCRQQVYSSSGSSSIKLVGGVAQWLERRSLAGKLSLSCARPAMMGDY